VDLSDVKIEDTIFDGYDTIICDLDDTIWECFTPRGEGIGAYATNPPYTLKSSNILSDVDGNIIRLQGGVRDLFKYWDENNINIGIVSAGEKDNTLHNAQKRST
jgi:predicted phosphatase